MPIPLINFPMPTFQQANPWLQGAQGAQALQRQAIQNQYLAPLLRAQLAQRQAQTGLTQAQTGEIPYQTQLLQERAEAYPGESAARIAQEKAATAQAQAQTKLAPITALTHAMQTAQTGTRFGPAYQLSRIITAMSPNDRAQYIANNQGAYNSMLDILGNAALQQQQGGGMPTGIMGEAIRQQFPQFIKGAQKPQQIAQVVTPQAAQPQQSLLTKPAAQLTPKQKEQKLQQSTKMINAAQSAAQFGTTPQQTQTMKLQNLYNSNREGLSDKMKTQQDFAIRFERFLKNYQPNINKQLNSILEYAGAKGRGQRYFEQWSNANNDKVSDYDTFERVFVPNMTNMIRQMETMGATDEQQKTGKGMLDIINNVTSNPKRAKMAINKAIDLIRTLSDSTIGASEPVNKGVTRQLYSLPKVTGDYIQGAPQQGQKYSNEDIAYTARQTGMSEDAIRKKLGYK